MDRISSGYVGTDGSRRLGSGPLSRVYALDGPGRSVVVKLAPPEVLAREAVALAAVPGGATAPAVLAAGEGVLVLSTVPGVHVAPAALGAGDLRTLAAAVRRIHDARVSQDGRWPEWPEAEATLPGYHARVVTAVREAAADGVRARVERILAALPSLPAAVGAPFRSLHGDLWSGNLLWDAGRPAFLDWEYARQGDPAEELAYLIEMDAFDADQVTTLTAAYDEPTVAARVAAWRPLTAVSAAVWYAEAGVEDRAEALLRQAERD